MNELTHCPYCSYPVSGESVTLWDARTYCRKCVEEVSPALYDFATTGGQLHDSLDRNDIGAHHYISFIGKWYLVAVMLIFGLPFGLLFLAGKADVLGLVFVLAFFGGGGMIFLSLQSLLGVVVLRSRLPRKLAVENGQLIIATPKDEKSVPITDCKWYFGSTATDQPCMFTRLRRGVVIQTPESQIGVGHDHDMLEHWRAFLSLTRISENPPRGCLRLIGIAGTGMILGLLVGSGIGYIVSIITNNNVWTPALGFMGVIEGAAVALIYASCTSDGAVAARKRLHPALVGLAFFVIGIKFGVIGGLPGALVCGTINSVFGALVAWFCRATINAAEMEHELAGQLRH